MSRSDSWVRTPFLTSFLTSGPGSPLSPAPRTPPTRPVRATAAASTPARILLAFIARSPLLPRVSLVALPPEQHLTGQPERQLLQPPLPRLQRLRGDHSRLPRGMGLGHDQVYAITRGEDKGQASGGVYPRRLRPPGKPGGSPSPHTH